MSSALSVDLRQRVFPVVEAGVPIVSAGLTEDKAEVGARIGSSGVGSNSPRNRLSIEAVDTALADLSFRRVSRVAGRPRVRRAQL